jgi:hypothetical protein
MKEKVMAKRSSRECARATTMGDVGSWEGRRGREGESENMRERGRAK